MKLLSADDKESNQSKKTNNSRRIKEALTIKDLGVEAPEEAEAIEIMFI